MLYEKIPKLLSLSPTSESRSINQFQLMLLGSKFELYCSLNIRRLDQCFFYNAITSYFGYSFALITMLNIYRMFYIISVLAAARDVDHAAPV